MFKKTTLRYLFAAIMSFVIALTLAMPVTTIASEAGFFASDPNVNLAEGDKYMPMTINNVTINAGGRWYIKSEAEKKSCGSYVNFQKYIYFDRYGAINSLSFQSTVTGPTQLIIFVLGGEDDITGNRDILLVRNFAKYNSEAERGTLKPSSGTDKVVTLQSGDIGVELEPSNSANVQKLVYSLPEAGTYHVYLSSGNAKFYGIYFGAITDNEAKAMGKVFEEKGSGSVAATEAAPPVFWIALIIFVLAVIAYIILINKKGGKGAFKKVIGKDDTPHSKDISYKE